jgi:hypothetical protein
MARDVGRLLGWALVAGLLLNFVASLNVTYESRKANRLLIERNHLFREWANTFRRIEERQVLYLSTVKSDIPPEQWARIEELNRDAGLK